MNSTWARRALTMVALSTGIGLAGCVVSTVGAPCVADDNCPATQHCGPLQKCEAGAPDGGGTTGGGGGTTGGGGGTTGGGGGTTGGGGGTTGGGGGTTGGGGGTTGGGGGTTGGGGGTTGGGGGGVVVQPRIDVVSASGRMEGGDFKLDMQVGDSRNQAPMTGTNTGLETGAAVKP